MAFSMATFVPKRIGDENAIIMQSLGTAGGSDRENIEAWGRYLNDIDFCLVDSITLDLITMLL